MDSLEIEHANFKCGPNNLIPSSGWERSDFDVYYLDKYFRHRYLKNIKSSKEENIYIHFFSK